VARPDDSPLAIAVDAMGGDHAPDAIVRGALDAVAALDVEVLLAGPPDVLTPLFPDGAPPAGVTILPASEVIGMHEEPARAVRSKKDASLVRAAEAVRDGRAAAMVGAGNTGATMAAALLRMGRIRGVHRPAIAVPVPVVGAERPGLLLDAGATVDPEPQWMLEWARLGREYARVRFGIDAPTIGLLSNGEEQGKGDTLRKETDALLADLKGYVGNVEGRDLLHGTADVVVTDGFTGNVALKVLEGTVGLYTQFLREAFRSSLLGRLGYALAKPALQLLRQRLDPRRYNGAMFLGLNGIVVKSHGGTDALGFANAIGVAVDLVQQGTNQRITAELNRLEEEAIRRRHARAS
jgi:glycerol-3-phosphate acyltransferase PlsX